MALIDRVKERCETNVLDAEIQRVIDEALLEIIRRYGPHADVAVPITVTLEGKARSLFPARPIDTAVTVVVKETVADVETTLASNDYRIWHGGRRLERLLTGTNPRESWGHPVKITYAPTNDGNQREEVVIKLVKLALDYEGVASSRVGDTSTDYHSYTAERERLLASLAPSRVQLA